MQKLLNNTFWYKLCFLTEFLNNVFWTPLLIIIFVFNLVDTGNIAPTSPDFD